MRCKLFVAALNNHKKNHKPPSNVSGKGDWHSASLTAHSGVQPKSAIPLTDWYTASLPVGLQNLNTLRYTPASLQSRVSDTGQRRAVSENQLSLSSSIKYYCWYSSPIGELLLAGTEDALHYISFPQGSRKGTVNAQWERTKKPFHEVCTQLGAYFKGELTTFDLPLAPTGTPFQQQVWSALLEIPYGQTESYAKIAQKINRPKATRAVGNANGRNPIPIIIPCHRVIGRDGSLTGFGGGLPTKSFLLQLEDSEQLSLPF